MISRVFVTAVAILLSNQTVRAADDSRDGRAERDVREAVERSVEMFNRHDAAGYADAYSERATITPLDREVVGRDEIRRFFEQAFKGELKDAVLKLKILRVRVVRAADVAVCDLGETHASRPKDPEESCAAVMVREGDRWLIGAIRYTVTPPKEKEKPPVQQPLK
jgi:uncharacterized protein (TIGR02246 family)